MYSDMQAHDVQAKRYIVICKAVDQDKSVLSCFKEKKIYIHNKTGHTFLLTFTPSKLATVRKKLHFGMSAGLDSEFTLALQTLQCMLDRLTEHGMHGMLDTDRSWHARH